MVVQDPLHLGVEEAVGDGHREALHQSEVSISQPIPAHLGGEQHGAEVDEDEV